MAKRALLKERIDDLVVKRRKLDNELTEAQSALDDLDHETKCARAVSVPWPVFETAATHSRSAWQEVEVTDVYEQHRECANCDTCWYSGNMDRLQGLELFKIDTLDARFSLTLCDLCLGDREEFLNDNAPIQVKLGAPNAFSVYTKKRDAYMVDVDPDAYEPAIAAYLRKAAAGEDVSEIALTRQ